MNTKEKNVSKKRSLKKLSGIGLVILVILLAGLTGAYIHQNRKAHVITFYLVRHGQTYANVQWKMVGGDGESKLTAEGIQTSIATGKALKDVNFDSVYCSTLKRTQQTAKYILQGADKTGLTVQKEKGLLDIHLGNMEGLTPNEFLTKYQLTAIPDAFGGSRRAAAADMLQVSDATRAWRRGRDSAPPPWPSDSRAANGAGRRASAGPGASGCPFCGS